MDVLDQARMTVAERMIATQHREISSLRIQNEISKRRAAVATLAQSPFAPIFIMALVYAIYCGIDLWATHRKKEKTKK